MCRRFWLIPALLFGLFFLLLVPHTEAWIKKRKDVNIPTKEVIIQPGDTLRRLAARYLGDPDRWKEFLKVNEFSNPDVLSPGETLYVPLEATAPSSPSPSAPVSTRPQIQGLRQAARLQWLVSETSFPVGTPQILVVRVEDPRGVPVPNARVEWLIHTSPQSVGDILEADVETHPAGATVGKRTNHFAITYTRDKPTTLTLSGKTLQLSIGETWVSLLATRPGITDLSVFCPDIPRHLEYYSTRVFSWRDLSWEIPTDSEASVDLADPSQNVVSIPVRVRHLTDSRPAEGVWVRYTLLSGGPKAQFEGGNSAYLAQTDSEGQAKAKLGLQEPVGGSNRIRVEILDAQQRVIAAQELTHLWRGPSVQVRQEGPEILGVLAQAAYTIVIENQGTAAINALRVTEVLPTQGIALVNVGNDGRTAEGEVFWDIETFPPGETVRLSFSVQGNEPGEWTGSLQLTSQEGLKLQRAVPFRVQRPRLEIQIDGPSRVQVGQEVEYQVRVNNPGSLQATNVLVNHTLPESGLTFIESSEKTAREENNLVWYLDVLEGGASRQITLRLRAEEQGTYAIQAKVNCNEGVRVHAQTTTEVTPPALSLTLAAEPTVVNLDHQVTLKLLMRNRGSAPVRDLLLMEALPAGLGFVSADQGGQLDEQGRVIWHHPQVVPGDQVTFQVIARGAVPGEHVVRASFTGDDGMVLSAETTVTVVARPVLRMRTTDNADPIRVGDELVYTTVVENVGRGQATEVKLSVALPASVRIIETTASAGRPKAQGNNVDFIIGTLGPGEQVELVVRLLTLEPGDLVHSAVLTYAEFSQPLRVEEPTVVIE